MSETEKKEDKAVTAPIDFADAVIAASSVEGIRFWQAVRNVSSYPFVGCADVGYDGKLQNVKDMFNQRTASDAATVAKAVRRTLERNPSMSYWDALRETFNLAAVVAFNLDQTTFQPMDVKRLDS